MQVEETPGRFCNRKRDTMGVENPASLSSCGVADSHRSASQPCQETATQKTLKVHDEVKPLGAEQANGLQPSASRSREDDDFIDTRISCQDLAPLPLDQPGQCGRRIQPAERGSSRERMDDVAQGTRFDDQQTADVTQEQGHSPSLESTGPRPSDR